MKKLKWMGLLAATFLISMGHAQARDCELPHEWLQARCQNAADADAVSGIEKAEKPDLSQIVLSYRDKSRAFTNIVEKAEEDYLAHSAKKRANQLPK